MRGAWRRARLAFPAALTSILLATTCAQADVIRFGATAEAAKPEQRPRAVFRYDRNGRLILPPKPDEPEGNDIELMAASTKGSGDIIVGRAPVGEYLGALPSVRQTALRYQNHPAIIAAGLTKQEWLSLFEAMIWQESRFNQRAKSPKGALGLAQLMPGTASLLGVDPSDPMQNLDGGARYLLTQLQNFRSPTLALAAYNAGPAAVRKYGGVPPYRETRDYVVRILSRHEQIMARN